MQIPNSGHGSNANIILPYMKHAERKQWFADHPGNDFLVMEGCDEDWRVVPLDTLKSNPDERQRRRQILEGLGFRLLVVCNHYMSPEGDEYTSYDAYPVHRSVEIDDAEAFAMSIEDRTPGRNYLLPGGRHISDYEFWTTHYPREEADADDGEVISIGLDRLLLDFARPDWRQIARDNARRQREQEWAASPKAPDTVASVTSPPLKMVPFTDCFGETPPARRWIVKDWIPAEGEVTSLYGDGGVGKTLLAQLTQAKLALGYNWFGHSAMPVRSLGFYCEDSANELWRRRHRILRHLFGGREPSDHDMRMLAGAMECSRVGEDNLLMTFDRQGKGQVTAFQRQIVERARDERAQVVILDNASTMFPGDAVNASMVRQFVDIACGGIASAIHGAVILCAHPSKSGMSTGSGDAGSVQWNAAVRSRLYLRRPQVDGVEDRSALVLSRMKGNYADVRSDVEIPLRWTNDGVLDLNAPDGADHRPPATEVFLHCLDERVRQGRFVSDKARGSTYAPKIFAGMPAGRSCGYSKAQFESAMQSLFLSNEIELAWIHGVDRHAKETILRPGQCMELRKAPSRRMSDADAADIDALNGGWDEDGASHEEGGR